MRLLAVEASTSLPSCALWLDGHLVEWRGPGDRNSSETLLPAIMALLAGQGVGLGELDGIAFGAGPGAFTGLRVAAAVVQGLAVVHETPVVPIETLAAVAWASGADAALATLDARMNEVYAATYRREGDRLTRIGELCVAPPATLTLPAGRDDWLVCGNAVVAYPALAERLDGWRVAPPSVPTAGAIAALAAPVLAAGGGLPPEAAQPIYVRDKVAFTTAERLAAGGRA